MGIRALHQQRSLGDTLEEAVVVVRVGGGEGEGRGGRHGLACDGNNLFMIWLPLINDILHCGGESAADVTIQVKGRITMVTLLLPDFQLPLQSTGSWTAADSTRHAREVLQEDRLLPESEGSEGGMGGGEFGEGGAVGRWGRGNGRAVITSLWGDGGMKK